MIDFTNLRIIFDVLGKDVRAYLSTAYPWLPVAVVAAFSLANSLRVLAYVPQIIKTARDQNGATAISFVTWGHFFLSHLTTFAYAVVSLGDIFMALIFLANAFACLLILIIAIAKRKRHLRLKAKNEQKNSKKGARLKLEGLIFYSPRPEVQTKLPGVGDERHMVIANIVGLPD
jgi:uncharacterized protein with PQ loop repeat